jgi:hypothetical protein
LGLAEEKRGLEPADHRHHLSPGRGNGGKRPNFTNWATTLPRPFPWKTPMGTGIAIDFPRFHRLYDDDWIVLFIQSIY